MLQAPNNNLALHDQNHNACSPHKSYLDQIIEGVHRRKYASQYQMMTDLEQMLEYAGQRIASSASADTGIGRFSCVPVDIMHICAAQTRKFEPPDSTKLRLS